MKNPYKTAFVVLLGISIFLLFALVFILLQSREQTTVPETETAIPQATATITVEPVVDRDQDSDQLRATEEYQALINRLETANLSQQQAIRQLNGEIQTANNRVLEVETALAEMTRANDVLSSERDALTRRINELQVQIEAVRALIRN